MLNSSQQQAVSHQGSHLLIIAGPGTGKTHTLTHRIAQIAQFLNPNEKILAITFTNKAALEMQHRLSSLSGAVDNILVGTFHSFCLKVLQNNAKEAGLPTDFRVTLPEEIEDLVKDLWQDKKPGERKKLLQEISYWKATSFDRPVPGHVSAYNHFLHEKKFLDFDDLLLKTLSFSVSHTSLFQDFRYIFVDEYQDINPAQHALLKTLVRGGVGITAIGDPNQAIYGFRGSDVKFFESFKKDFPGAEVLSLEENYRSAQNLLTASGQVIAKSKFTYVSNLTAKIFQEGWLVIYEAPTDKAEAEFVVHEIEKMVGGTSMFSHDSKRVTKTRGAERSFGDIAVFYRLNSQKNLLKEAFERSGIPYETSGEKALEDEFLPRSDHKYQERSEKVQLMTIHASKGLEFPVVFMVGCEQNLLPLNLEGLKSNVDEERRLFYVGMTRAREQLYLIRTRRRMLYGKTCQNLPSPFLSDIEEELMAYEKGPARRPRKENKQSDLFM